MSSGGSVWAHSANIAGRRHALEGHLRGAEALARGFGSEFGAGDLAGYLALVHDVGKGACSWQDGLLEEERSGKKVAKGDHKRAGLWLAARGGALPWEFGGVVFGHHGGLPAGADLKAVVREIRAAPGAVDEVIGRVATIVPEITDQSGLSLPSWLSDDTPLSELKLRLDLLLRMLFSCVVDADYLDTEAHFADRPVRLAAPADLAALAARYERRRMELLSGRKPSAVDAIREDVYAQALRAADGPPGIYQLQVPTGGAKTFASGGFALRHAAVHGMRRIVVAVPYISITQQNGGVYRDLLDPADGGPPVVLEHHSSVDLDDPGNRWGKLAAENWDARFIVTTTVQLFESLYACRPSAMRRLHRLSGAVIVLDEVQSLPDRLLAPILSGLRDLVAHFGATVLLSSATQPEFWRLSPFASVPRRRVVEDPEPLFASLRRVRYLWRCEAGLKLADVARDAAENRQVLVIVNTTKDSAAVHRVLETEWSFRDPDAVFHLSTRMTAEHRRSVIEQVKNRLASGEPVAVVSTQLIEAGVDLDFPRVYRAWAPAESLQQAAGRCNRDGRLAEPGTVVVFDAEDAGQPKGDSYTAALAATASYFGPGKAHPDDLEALSAYYAHRYEIQKGDRHALGTQVEALRQQLDFPAVTEAFQMIEDGYSQPVVVVRDTAGQDAIESSIARLRSGYPCGPEVLRGLQPHTASLPRFEAATALRQGLAEQVIGDLLVWRGLYHPMRGIEPA